LFDTPSKTPMRTKNRPGGKSICQAYISCKQETDRRGLWTALR
jgi:hypothetical protein